MQRTNNILALIAGMFAILVVLLIGMDRWEGRAVSVDVQVRFEPQDDFTTLHMDWTNRRNCSFRELVAMQGSDQFPDQVRSPIVLDFGKPKGSRGIGHQETQPAGWMLHRPDIVTGPDVILVVWHRCGDRDVPSTMFVVPIETVFPARR